MTRGLRIVTYGLVLLASRPALAATLDSDGSAGDTQAKVDSAANGDVVLLPSSGSFTWSADVTLPSSKAITLDLDGSTVTLSGAGNELAIESSDTGLGGVNRITNGQIVRGSGYNLYGGPFSVQDSRNGAGLRVDHITFTGQNVLVDIRGQGAGVMDNCAFTGLSWAQEFIHVVGWGAVDATGWTTDSGSALAGSGDIFYLEDCAFIQDTSSSGVAWIQGYYGARIGIRHNSFDWVSVDMHGTSGMIGARWWECYENEFDNDSTSGQPSWAFSMRAGSGVLHDNVMASGAGHSVSIGLCEEDTGYPADYQIGRGLNQELDPAYVWNNGPIDLSVNACDAPEQPGMVEIDRDVVESARPGYSPYAYPHPLRDDAGGTGGSSSSAGGAGAGAGGGAAESGAGGSSASGASSESSTSGPGGPGAGGASSTSGSNADDGNADAGGCGCRTAATSSPWHTHAWVLGLLLLAGEARRRRSFRALS